MSDPRKKKHRVGWRPTRSSSRTDGGVREVDGERVVGIMSVLFYVAFLFPPIWWCASVVPSSRIRHPHSSSGAEPQVGEKDKDKERQDWEIVRDLQEGSCFNSSLDDSI